MIQIFNDILRKLSFLESVAIEKSNDLNQIEKFPINKYSKTNIGNDVQKANLVNLSYPKGFQIRNIIKEIKGNQKLLKNCRFCEDTFTRKESARRHEKTSHEIKIKSKIPDQTKFMKKLKKIICLKQ